MRRFFLVFILLLTSIVIHAQNFKAGIRLGMSASQVNGDGLTGFNKAGLIAGAYVYRDLSDYFSLQMEMIYIQKGSRKPTDDYNNYYRMRVNYIEVPLILRWHTSKKFDVTGGLAYGALVFSEEDDQFGVYENAEPFEKYEFSGSIGFIYKLGNNWSFDGRYSESIIPIRTYPGYSSDYFDKGQVNVLIELTLIRDF